MLLNDVMNLNISMNKKMKNPLLIIWLCLYIVFNALCSFFSCRYRMHCWCCWYHVVDVSCWQRRNANLLVSTTVLLMLLYWCWEHTACQSCLCCKCCWNQEDDVVVSVDNFVVDNECDKFQPLLILLRASRMSVMSVLLKLFE